MNETTCNNNNMCLSIMEGIPADMSLGDTCVLCCCRDCERCGELIDVDEETQIVDGPGYIDVCERCVTTDDVHYDPDPPGTPTIGPDELEVGMTVKIGGYQYLGVKTVKKVWEPEVIDGERYGTTDFVGMGLFHDEDTEFEIVQEEAKS